MSGLRGAVELDRSLSRLLRAARPDVQERALRAGAEVIADEARTIVHRRSGQLADSIEVSTEAADDRSAQGDVKVFAGPTLPDGFHGLFEELGTIDTPAHAFMRPAFDGQAGNAERAIADEVSAEIKRQTGG